MIITCASCLTKFNLDDSRIQAKGIKVRCSRCKHIFYVVPPPETKEEMIENAESFAKFHEELMGPGEKETEAPQETEVQKEEVGSEREEEEVGPEREEEEAFPDLEKAAEEKTEQWPSPSEFREVEEPMPPEKAEQLILEEPRKAERKEGRPSRPKGMAQAAKRGPLRFVPLVIIVVLLIFGIFYVWTELSMGGRLSSYLEYPVKKVTELWNQVWGVEKEDLTVGDINIYDAQVEGLTLFVIEGKVKNQSKLARKHVKLRISIFDEEKVKVAEQDAICGRLIGREELKRQPPEFFKGDMIIKPETEREMVVPAGKEVPFMVIFKNLPSRAKDFKYEILEAPEL